MKRILALVSSPRKLANGEMLTREVAKASSEAFDLEIIKLTDLNLGLCRGCYSCLRPGQKCPIEDDFYHLLNKMKEADGIILSAPCYALGPNAVTKLLGDRVIASAQSIEELWGKPCVVIATAGIEGWEGYILTSLNTTVRFLGLELKDSHLFIGALPGEGVIREGALERAQEMGEALFGQARKTKKGECPTCWSELWKFNDTQNKFCAICGQEANLQMAEGGLEWIYKTKGNRFDKEELSRHFNDWLKGKVQEFISRRKEFNEIRNRYKEN